MVIPITFRSDLQSEDILMIYFSFATDLMLMFVWPAVTKLRFMDVVFLVYRTTKVNMDKKI